MSTYNSEYKVKVEKIAKSLVSCFCEEAESSDVYDLIDYAKSSYRADMPEAVYNDVIRRAVEMFKAKSN